MNDLLMKALRCENEGRPPVWLMRQAGRYLPEFRALREKYDFMTLCKTPELVTEVTCMPVDRFGMDAAILFSDILVVLDAMERGLHFEKGRGPVIEEPLRSAAEIASLVKPNVRESLGYVAEGIKALRGVLKVPLIGFCGAPFTVASYLIEGGSSKQLRRTKQWLFRDPNGFRKLLDHICQVTIDYCRLQIEAGAQVLQIFDSWADHLAWTEFCEFSLFFQKDIVDALKPTGVPIILYCRGSSVFAQDMAMIGPDAVSIDRNADLSEVALWLEEGIAVQGNLDPDVLYGDATTVREQVTELLDTMEEHPGYIFNLGQGMNPDIDPDRVQVLVDTVKSYQPATV